MSKQSPMSATPLIHDLVRQGRIRPNQGAKLLELRRDLRRQRMRQSRGFVGTAIVFLVTLIFVIFGARRNTSA